MAPRALIVEDDTFIRTLVGDFLRQRNWEVVAAASGEEGLAKVRPGAFDAAILDLLLPGQGGLQILQDIRRIDPDLPVLILTGVESPQVAATALRYGAFSYLRKSTDLVETGHLLQQAAERCRLTRENRQLRRQVDILRAGQAVLRETTKGDGDGPSIPSLQNLYQMTVDLAARALEVENVSLMLLNRERDELRIASAKGLEPTVIGSARSKIGEGIAGVVAREGRPLLIRAAADGSQALLSGRARYRHGSCVSVPLKVADRVIGVLNATNRSSGEDFSEEDLDLFEGFSSLVSLVLLNIALYRRQRLLMDFWVRARKDLDRRQAAMGAKAMELAELCSNILDPSGPS